MDSPLYVVLGKLEGVKKNGSGYSARCPSHDDKHASLSVSEGDDGRALVNCHAGCDPHNVVVAMGLAWTDLFPENPSYRITDNVRHIRINSPNGKTYIWKTNGKPGLNGVSPENFPLYLARHLTPDDTIVIVCEGEKAAQALRDIGVPAVGTVGGAASTPSDGSLADLYGRDVWLWPDNDEPGRRHMQAIARRLDGHSDIELITWPEAPEHGDAADYVKQGGTTNDIPAMAGDFFFLGPSKKNEETNACPHVEASTAALGVVCLACKLEPRERTWRIARLVPDNAVTMFYGDAGIGKSFITLLLAICMAAGEDFAGLTTRRGRVLFVDAELDVDEHSRRAWRLSRGLGLKSPPAGLIYASLPDSLGNENGRSWLMRTKMATSADVVVVDSLTYASWGTDLNAAGEMGAILHHLKTLGTVIVADHTQWAGAAGNQSDAHPIGSFAKKMACRSIVQVNGSEDSQSITLRPNKSNFGKISDPVYVELEHKLDAVTLSVIRQDDEKLSGAERHMRPAERVLFHMHQLRGEEVTVEALAEDMDLSPKRVRDLLTVLRKRGQVDTDKRGSWHVVRREG